MCSVASREFYSSEYTVAPLYLNFLSVMYLGGIPFGYIKTSIPWYKSDGSCSQGKVG